jgi:transposase
MATGDSPPQRRQLYRRGAPDVERSFAWVSRNRRLGKDYQQKAQTSECLLKIAMIRFMLKRLGRN